MIVVSCKLENYYLYCTDKGVQVNEMGGGRVWGSEVNNLQTVAPCCIDGWCRTWAVSLHWDTSLLIEGKCWDGVSSYASVGAGKQEGSVLQRERVW